MFVKKFEAPSLEEALSLVKHEFGPNALILSTQTLSKKWFQKPFVEVTAASERKEQTERNDSLDDDPSLNAVFPHRRYELSSLPKLKDRPSEQKYIDMQGPKAPQNRQADLSALEQSFVRVGMEAITAKELCRRLKEDYSKKDLSSPANLESAKARVVASYIKTISSDILRSRPEWVAVGSPGSGKTSTCVKLALYLRKRRLAASLVSGDKRKILGKNELAAYARLSKIPFHSEVNKHLSDTKIIDSPALSETVDTSLRVLCEGRSVVAVLDATSRLPELLRCIDKIQSLNPAAVAFTKLDVTNQFGVVFDVLKNTRLPILGASLSSSFVQEFKFFEPLELANFILKNRGTND